MWRLFKEVFKSLSKNKVMVIGLSILVFLTAAIFTLLTSVRNSMSRSFNNYKEVSRLHDISVDLNINANGSAYNNGYYVNGESSYDLSKKPFSQQTYTPIEYKINYDASFNNEGFKKWRKQLNQINNNELDSLIKKYQDDNNHNELSGQNITSEYVNISLIKNSDLNKLGNKYYFKKDDIISLYVLNTNNENVKWDLTNIEDPYVKFNQNTYKMALYEKDKNNNFVRAHQQNNLDLNTSLTFDKNYLIGDLLRLTSDNNREIVSQISPIFVNVVTKEATLDYSKGINWINEQQGYRINVDQIAKYFDFKKDPNDDLNYILDSNKNLNEFVNINNNQKLNEQLTLKKVFNSSLFIDENKTISQDLNYTFKEQKYNIPQEWINSIRINTSFLRLNYYTSFVDKIIYTTTEKETDENGKEKIVSRDISAKDLWSGSYKTYMLDLLADKEKNKNLLNNLEIFSYWYKKQVETGYKYENINGKWTLSKTPFYTKESESQINPNFNFLDTNIVKLYTYDNRKLPIDDNSRNIYKIDLNQALTIKEIEKKNNPSLNQEILNNDTEFYNSISDQSIRDKRFKIIQDNALRLTKENIINKVTNLVGKENIGLRKTITVDSVSDSGEKNVFHFIDAGDRENKVDGVELNVGKLYNEQFSPSKLLTLTNKSDLFNNYQIPPNIASLIIQNNLTNQFNDPDYVQPIIQYLNIEYTNPLTKNKSFLTNQKVVWLNSYVKDQKTIKNANQIPNYLDTNLGVYGNFDSINLVKKYKKEDGSYGYKTYYLNGQENGLNYSLLTAFMEKNNLTIATSFIKTNGDGWVKYDDNEAYIPFKFWSIRDDLNQLVIKSNSVEPLIKEGEKIIIDLDIVKKGFVQTDLLYRLFPLIQKALDDVNFTSVLTTAKINNSTVFKFLSQLIYYASHDNYGNLLNLIFNNFIDKIKNEVIKQGDDEKQKAYLIEQINNLFITFDKLNGVEKDNLLLVTKFVNLFKKPTDLFDLIKNIASVIDTKTFSSLWKEWYDNSTNISDTYKPQLTVATLINMFIKSIDPNGMQQILTNLIDKINFKLLLSTEKDSLISLIFRDKNILNILYSIIPKIDTNKDGNFTNVIEGLKSFIKAFDFNYFKSNFSSTIQTNNIDYVVNNNSLTNSVIKHYKIDELSVNKLIRLIIKSQFHTAGSSKGFKENVIRTFNLSSATTRLNYDNSSIWLPAQDENKLSFIDLLNAISNSSKNNSNNSLNTNSENSDIPSQIWLLNSLDVIKNSLATIKNDKFEINKITDSNLKNFINNNIKPKEKTITKNEVINFIDSTKDFIKQTIGGINKVSEQSQKTGADLLADLDQFYGGNSIRILLKTLFNNLIPLNNKDDYFYGQNAFSIFIPYINMYQVSDANKEESDKFVNDFLNLAVDNEILKIASEVNNNINVPFSSTTNYTVNKFISDPTSVTLFNVDNQGKFINSKIEKLATNNPKFRNYLLKHRLELIIQLGYIAQSNKFANNFTDDATKSAYYIAISSFVKNYLMSNSFFNIRNNAIGILSYIDKNYLPLEIIGISSSLLNPVLRSLFPEVAISYIAVETNSNNSSLVNGNLAYFVSDKINNLELLGMDNSSSSELLEQYLNYNNSTNFVVNEITGNADNDEEIKIDGLWFKTIKSFNAPSSFGINLIDLQYDALSSVLGEQDLKVAPMQLPRFYLAKVNFAYLSANKKKIYDGEIPTDKPFLKTETDNFINRFDDSYIINVNGIKYIIVGEETTVDYMYPVIDENNLQVDTKHQALVYVNNNGFNRIKDAYAGNIIKENLLVKAPENVNVDQLKSQIIKIVDNSIVNTNNLQRVFKNNETDIINPERALRITTITNIIKVILVATIALVLLFSFLVIVSIIFIIKRYINSKNKVLGILIAQGYTPNQIASSLFVFAFITALIGGILGYIVGNRLQFEVLDTFSGYWTLPKNTLIFNPIAAIFTFITPCFIICLIIYLITITTLRIKPLDLINDNNSIPKHKLFAIYTNKIRKYNVKTRFSFILSYIGIWKLISFAISIVLVTTASLFGVTNRGVFNDTINLTYQNRNYKYKMNLQTPTAEAGLIKGYDNSNLKDLIYTPIGTAAEIQTTLYNFVAPGISPVINNKNSNGNPGVLDPHVTSQFSLDLVIASGYSLNPWDLAYQSMPDSQRTKIDSIRDQIGNELEQSQNNRIIDNKTYIFTNSPDNKNMIIYANKDNLNDVKNYFAYYKAFAEKTGHFVYKKWNGDSYETIRVTTDLRNEYRDFIVNGYDYIQKQIDLETNNPSLINDQKYINDYFISFSGVVFNKKTDEKYTYIDTDKGKIDGYRKDSKFISLKDLKGNDLLKELYDYKVENDIYPLVINDVARKKHKWSIGEVVTFRINNEVHRYLDKITNYKRNLEVKFKIIGINSTYINEELITTQEIANKLTGLSSIVPKELKNTDFIPFNGILSNQDNPVQITGSASLYSPSNYWPIITSFEANESNAKDIYNQLFNVENGLFIHNLVNNGFSLNDAQKQLAIFLDSSMNLANANAEKAYNNGLESPRELINKFANIYNNSLYTLLSSSLDAKDIEVSFVSKIGTTVNNVTIGIIWVTIIISLTILIIISTIIITENKRNIAIWAILGYKESEKLKMFFSIFIPFIVLAIIISIPATLLLIYLFNIFMLQAGSIVLMISLSFPQIISVVLAVFAIFICTALLTWYSIGKIKPIQLLKD